jgi:uncharacterized protein (DUF1499 family)
VLQGICYYKFIPKLSGKNGVIMPKDSSLLTIFLSKTTLLSLAGAIVLGTMAAPLAVKWDLWHFTAAFSALKLLFYIGIGVVVIALVLMTYKLVKQGVQQALPYALCVAICALPIGNMLYQVSQVKSLPLIHDITTDTVNPPPFLVATTLRASSDNSSEYDANIRLQQLDGYPDILPLYSEKSLAKTFELVSASVESLGYKDIIRDNDLAQLEFSDQTFWFGFIDDIVIRVSREQQKSRIDIRSASRVGKSDIGKNARRIRVISQQLKALL